MKTRAARRASARGIASAFVASALLAQSACATEPKSVSEAVDLFDPPQSDGSAARTPESAPGTTQATANARDEGAAAVPGQADARVDAGVDARGEVVARPDPTPWLERGEAAYRARRFDEAMGHFERIVAAQPENLHAWLRLGNLHQHRRDWFKALAAYRRVASRARGEGAEPVLRAKALFNIASINLELARQTLVTLERMGPITRASVRVAPLANAIEETQRRLDALGRSRSITDAPAPQQAPRASTAVVGAQVGDDASSAPTRAAGATDARGAAPRESVGRRRVAAQRPGAASRDELPRVDYILGAPRP